MTRRVGNRTRASVPNQMQPQWNPGAISLRGEGVFQRSSSAARGNFDPGRVEFSQVWARLRRSSRPTLCPLGQDRDSQPTMVLISTAEAERTLLHRRWLLPRERVDSF
jgi:hypothetical protein